MGRGENRALTDSAVVDTVVDHGDCIAGVAGLVGTITDAVSKVGVVAQAEAVPGLAAEESGLGDHVGHADLLEGSLLAAAQT